ncbi:MAG: gamma-glutamyl-phosphate reductase, partial [Campylobacteraceae bacterium 4484_4]
IIETKEATEEDFDTEYLANILSICIVEGVDEAITHIRRYGSGHSEAIVTENYTTGETFLNAVDAACVYINASTQFTDGGEFGFGAEVGISTNKLHARGPMGINDLTTYKYKIYGNGQIRA